MIAEKKKRARYCGDGGLTDELNTWTIKGEKKFPQC